MVDVTQEDRGVRGAIMDALWPILGGDMLPTDMWYDISEAVTTALAAQEAELAAERAKVERYETAWNDLHSELSWLQGHPALPVKYLGQNIAWAATDLIRAAYPEFAATLAETQP